MTYQEFVIKMQNRLNYRQKQSGNVYSVSAETVEKIQASYYGLLISVSTISDAKWGINLKPYYFEFLESKVSMDDMVDRIDRRICYEIEHLPKYDLSNLKDYEYVKNHLGLQVINMEINQDLLKRMPYTQIADLALIYRVFLDEKTSALVNNNMLKYYGISRDQLHSDTMSCVQRKAPFFIRQIGEVLVDISEKILKEEIPEEERKKLKKRIGDIKNDPPLQIYIGGIDGAYGASVIARPDFFEKATQVMGGDFYIIPSSIHEVIILKDLHQGDIEALETTIWKVNMLKVPEEDYLSNNLYHYDSSNQIFETAADYEQRMKNGPEMFM